MTVVCDTPNDCPVVSVCAGETIIPCLDIGRAHREKLDLCDRLEAIADTLPANIDRFQCLHVANRLVPLFRATHAYEENYLFPEFGSDERHGNARRESIRRLTAEHIEDECAAQDITEVLMAIGHGAPVENPEALGFMLRAFFECVRRHIAFEREHILPVMAEERRILL